MELQKRVIIVHIGGRFQVECFDKTFYLIETLVEDGLFLCLREVDSIDEAVQASKKFLRVYKGYKRLLGELESTGE